MANITSEELNNLKLIAESLFDDEGERRTYIQNEIKTLQEMKKTKMQAELELEKSKYVAKLEAETKRHEIDVRSQLPNGFASNEVHKKPKLPTPQPYNAESERLDRFFDRFDVYSKASGFDDKEKAIALASLISGEVWTVVQTMSPDDQLSYSAIKKTLLSSFQYTTEGFKMRFKNMKPTTSDNLARFSQKALVAYDDWLKSANVKLTVEALREFFVMDLIYDILPTSIKTYIKERDSKTLQDLIKYGDIYIEARPNCSLENLCSKKDEQKSKAPSSKNNGSSKPSNGHIQNSSPDSQVGRYPQKQNNESIQYKTTSSHSSSEPNSPRPVEGEYYCSKHGAGNHSSEQCFTLHPELRPRGSRSPTQVSHISISENEELGHQLPSNSRNSLEISEEEKNSQIPPIKAPLDLMHSSSKTPSLQRAVLHKTSGLVNGTEVNILLDSGAECVFVDGNLVDKNAYLGNYMEVEFPEGPPVLRPLVNVNIDCPYFKGEVTAIALQNPRHAVFLGEIPGTLPFPRTDTEPTNSTNCNNVVTRQQAIADSQPLNPLGPLDTTDNLDPLADKEGFARAQKECSTLRKSFDQLKANKETSTRDGKLCRFVQQDGLLYHQSLLNGLSNDRLVIPKKYRKQVMYAGHDVPLSGHRGKTKTLTLISRRFYWPNMNDDIAYYVRSCHICQAASHKSIKKAPMCIAKLAATPFDHVCLDIIGPLLPASTRRHQYILTCVDQATRYADAIPLKNIDSEAVADAMMEMFSRTGIPKNITTDNGTQFSSNMFKSFLSLLNISSTTTAPYHAQSNGIVERFNGTLKLMLRRLASEQPHDWDRYLPALLFAYRDAPQTSLGYSPFELIFGHKARGPLDFLSECWTSNDLDQEDIDTHQYIFNLKKKLQHTCSLAREQLLKSQLSNKVYFDRRSSARRFTPGDKVLILLPTNPKKLLLQWKGPYTIAKRLNSVDYALKVGDKSPVYHINLLKRYYERDEDQGESQQPNEAEHNESPIDGSENNPDEISPKETLEIQQPSRTESVESFFEENPDKPDNPENHIFLGTAIAIEEGKENLPKEPSIPTDASETYHDCVINPELSQDQLADVQSVLQEFKKILSDLPGKTQTIEHRIELTDNRPIRHSYPLPHSLDDQLKVEIEKWLRLGIVESATSPYCSPLLAVRKKDGSHRFCLDCRLINSCTKFQGEPISDPDAIFQRLSSAKYLSKLDLSAGFWQIPLSSDSKPVTAFATRYGQFQFIRMPFGLVNAPGCFSKLMRIVTKDLPNVETYLDDILVATESWEEHIQSLRQLLNRLELHGLNAKPSKCLLGFCSLEYLGHVVGNNVFHPVEDKVKSIETAPVPSTKTMIKSFLGSVGYYQRFIPNFSTIAEPLFDLIKKNAPNKVEWNDSAQKSFDQLKQSLLDRPVLQLPNPKKLFVVQTDASDTGVGAVLLQESSADPRILAPIAYASRRFRGSELNYSTVEKEAFCIYWAIQKWELYLYARQFHILTDHRPLLYLQTADKLNPRIKRWAIYLSIFKFLTGHIKGSQNHLADYLSRL